MKRQQVVPLRLASHMGLMIGIFSVLLGCPVHVLGSAPTEPDVVSTEVRYLNGDRGSIRCEDSGCDLQFKIADENYRFRINDSDTPLRLIPRGLILYSVNHPVGIFSFELESDCSVLGSGGAPNYCVAHFSVQSGKIVEINERKVLLGRTAASARVEINQ